MELIQNWDNQDQQAKSFEMRYNLSKLNNWNYQTLTIGYLQALGKIEGQQ